MNISHKIDGDGMLYTRRWQLLFADTLFIYSHAHLWIKIQCSREWNVAFANESAVCAKWQLNDVFYFVHDLYDFGTHSSELWMKSSSKIDLMRNISQKFNGNANKYQCYNEIKSLKKGIINTQIQYVKYDSISLADFISLSTCTSQHNNVFFSLLASLRLSIFQLS